MKSSFIATTLFQITSTGQPFSVALGVFFSVYDVCPLCASPTAQTAGSDTTMAAVTVVDASGGSTSVNPSPGRDPPSAESGAVQVPPSSAAAKSPCPLPTSLPQLPTATPLSTTVRRFRQRQRQHSSESNPLSAVIAASATHSISTTTADSDPQIHVSFHVIATRVKRVYPRMGSPTRNLRLPLPFFCGRWAAACSRNGRISRSESSLCIPRPPPSTVLGSAQIGL